MEILRHVDPANTTDQTRRENELALCVADEFIPSHIGSTCGGAFGCGFGWCEATRSRNGVRVGLVNKVIKDGREVVMIEGTVGRGIAPLEELTDGALQ